MSSRTPLRGLMVAFVLVTPSVVAAQERTARDVIDLIVRDGPQANAIRAEPEVVRREQLARLSFPNPGILYSREGAGFAEFLEVEQSLPLFGTRTALRRAGAAATTAAEAERDARLWVLRADAAARVGLLLAEQTRVDVAESHVRHIERVVGILRLREREGEGSRFDRLRAEQELAETQQAMASAAVARADAHAAVYALLPQDVTVTRIVGALHQPGAVGSLAELIARAVSRRSEVIALRHAAERADLESDAARRARLPSPTLFGGLKRADDGDERARGGVLGVTASLPLFDAGGREGARWAAERVRADAERLAIEGQIRSEVTRALNALTLRQAALAMDQEAAGGELAAIAEVAYREGEMGVLELLDALRTALRARLRSLELQFEARLARTALERAVGDVLWP
jgi:cobalt-zinc-cadmium efflux system outer membrane protein